MKEIKKPYLSNLLPAGSSYVHLLCIYNRFALGILLLPPYGVC